MWTILRYMTEPVKISRLLLILSIFGLSAYFLAVPGCLSPRRGSANVQELPNVSDESAGLSVANEKIKTVGEGLSGRADRIEEGTDNVRDTLDSTGVDRRMVSEPLDAIDSEAQGLRQDSAELESARLRIDDLRISLDGEQEKIEDLTGNLGDAQGVISSLEKENRELRDKTNQLFKEKMAWIGVISVFGIGVSVVLIFLTRSGTATIIALGFVATLGISIAVSLYMSAIAWVTIAIVGIVAVGVIGYMAYQKLTDNKRVDELIQTNEVAKDYLSQEARDHIFGRGAEPGVADRIQSNATRAMVRQIRRTGKRKFDLSPRGSVIPQIRAQPSESSYFIVDNEKSVTY